VPDDHHPDTRPQVLPVGFFIVAPQPLHPLDFTFGLVITPHHGQVSPAKAPPAPWAFRIEQFLVGEIVLAVAAIGAYNEYFILDAFCHRHSLFRNQPQIYFTTG
jgi:hypothetical protein